jgi:hypothetical protein
MIGGMVSIVALLGLIAIAAAAIVRRVLDARIERRNVALLARRHDLDAATATRLYELARRDGFGSAWDEVVEHPVPVGRSEPSMRPAARQRTRTLADRHQA